MGLELELCIARLGIKKKKVCLCSLSILGKKPIKGAPDIRGWWVR
jgi:hypothetical protein